MIEAGKNNVNNGIYKIWLDAVRAKYFGGKGKKLQTAEDFDELLWRYQARASAFELTKRVLMVSGGVRHPMCVVCG